MSRGRPIKPLADKIADGTFRADRANLNEPQPSLFDPTNPFDQDAAFHAHQLWEFVVPELMENYSVGKGDQVLVESYCQAYQIKQMAWDELLLRRKVINEISIPAKEGTIDKEEIDQHVKVHNQYTVLVTKLAGQLGLDPINRAKIRGAKKQEANVPLSLLSFSRDRSRGPGGMPPMGPMNQDGESDELEDDGEQSA